MILLNSATHAKVGNIVREQQEMRAAKDAMPFLWRRTRQSHWYRLHTSMPRRHRDSIRFPGSPAAGRPRMALAP